MSCLSPIGRRIHQSSKSPPIDSQLFSNWTTYPPINSKSMHLLFLLLLHPQGVRVSQVPAPPFISFPSKTGFFRGPGGGGSPYSSYFCRASCSLAVIFWKKRICWPRCCCIWQRKSRTRVRWKCCTSASVAQEMMLQRVWRSASGFWQSFTLVRAPGGGGGGVTRTRDEPKLTDVNKIITHYYKQSDEHELTGGQSSIHKP